MRKVLSGLTMVASVHALALATLSPAVALSADLAKKCREMAIRAHPPAPAGTKAYAQAEREFFRSCIAKNGETGDHGGQKSPPQGNQ